MCILLVFLTYMYNDALFRECTEEKVAYHEGLCLVKMVCDQMRIEDGSTVGFIFFLFLFS